MKAASDHSLATCGCLTALTACQCPQLYISACAQVSGLRHACIRHLAKHNLRACCWYAQVSTSTPRLELQQDLQTASASPDALQPGDANAKAQQQLDTCEQPRAASGRDVHAVPNFLSEFEPEPCIVDIKS